MEDDTLGKVAPGDVPGQTDHHGGEDVTAGGQPGGWWTRGGGAHEAPWRTMEVYLSRATETVEIVEPLREIWSRGSSQGKRNGCHCV